MIYDMTCCQLKIKTKESFLHYIQSHLDTKVNSLHFDYCEDLDNDILKELALSSNASAIVYLNCHSTKITYNGLVALWNSPTFGCLVSDSPTYHRATGTPMATIKIEIGGTKALKQYQEGRFKYPLPLRGNFEITYGHRCLGEPYTLFGYKQIILLEDGKEILAKKLGSH
jgi:hypothetical protein